MLGDFDPRPASSGASFGLPLMQQLGHRLTGPPLRVTHFFEEVDPSDYWPVYSPTLVLPVPLQPVAP